MLLLIILSVAVADVRHGTPEQCTEWYPDDVLNEVRCSEIIDPKVLKEMARYSKICADLQASASASGLSLVSAELKDGEKTVTCGNGSANGATTQAPNNSFKGMPLRGTP